MTVALPQYNWIPNLDQLTDSGAGILAVVGTALDSYGRGEPYARRMFSHGLDVPVKTNTGTNRGQLLVSLANLFIGKAGQEQFQFLDGQIGQGGFVVADYQLDVLNEWPQPQGGNVGVQAQDKALMEAAANLWRDGLIVYSALRALMLHGITTEPPVAPIIEDNLHIGPLTPQGPDGGMAGFRVHVQVQL